jgi:hypothetical protein
MSGEDIPFLGAKVSIHQPRLKEISLIGESNFFMGSHFLLFNKNYLSDQDKKGLENKSDFDIFMAIVNSAEQSKHKDGALMLLTLLYPEYNILPNQNEILLQQEDKNFSSSINGQNFEEFQNIIRAMFAFGIEDSESKYDPADALAAKIADKINKRKKKVAESKGVDIEDIKVFSNYVSILAVGLKKNINDLMNYTIYQLKTEFKRYQLKINSDVYLKAKLAGAQDLEEVEDWMGDIHP